MATFLVTGAGRGLGLEFVRQLSKRGDEIVAVCRKCSPELKSLQPTQLIEGVDLLDLKNIDSLSQKVEGKIDVLINNAGVLNTNNLDDLDFNSIDSQMRVNAYAPLAITSSLAGKMASGSKVAMITSRMGSIEDNSSGGYYGYRMSKAALNAASKSLSIDLKKSGVSVGVYHPGFVRTDMTGNQGTVNASTSVSNLLKMIDQQTIETTGEFHHCNGEVLPW